jgi:hypothetical protein
MIRGVAPARDRPTVWHGANGAPVAKEQYDDLRQVQWHGKLTAKLDSKVA